jgi:DNA-binding CsgD family transcriptional regulator
MRTLRRDPNTKTTVVELDEAEWELVAEREHRLIALERACANLDKQELDSSLQRVAKALPLAAGAEMVAIRLLAAGRDALHLVAHEGLPSRHVRELALDPIPLAKQRTIFALGPHHTQARALGFRYLAGEWLRTESEVIGSLTIGCRTDRRPSPAQRELIRETAAAMGAALEDADRREEQLRTRALALARSAILDRPDVPEARLEALRPREATVLELYASGRTVDEIARALVISPHTVRTHIKLAFRRLGIHSREEAVELVQDSNVTALL